MQYTTLTELDKPAGTEPFARSILNGNMDAIDASMIALMFCAVAYGAGTVTKGAMVLDGDGNPSSQSINGPNGLAGSMTWSFTATTITETLSITAPVTFTVTKTVTLSDLSETWAFS